MITTRMFHLPQPMVSSKKSSTILSRYKFFIILFLFLYNYNIYNQFNNPLNTMPNLTIHYTLVLCSHLLLACYYSNNFLEDYFGELFFFCSIFLFIHVPNIIDFFLYHFCRLSHLYHISKISIFFFLNHETYICSLLDISFQLFHELTIYLYVTFISSYYTSKLVFALLTFLLYHLKYKFTHSCGCIGLLLVL